MMRSSYHHRDGGGGGGGGDDLELHASLAHHVQLMGKSEEAKIRVAEGASSYEIRVFVQKVMLDIVTP
jgi:hypothetical protein